MNSRTIKDLAEEASSAIDDLYFDGFNDLSDLQKVEWRYCHADCDHFASALNFVTGYPVVGIAQPRRGPMHRLVETPDGLMLDVMGPVSLDDLKTRYRAKSLKLARGGLIESMVWGATNEEDILSCLDVMAHLSRPPFDSAEMKALIQGAREKLNGYEVDAPTSNQSPFEKPTQ